MSKGKNKNKKSEPIAYERAEPFKPHVVDLKPHPKALIFFSILFALWVGVLLYLYFTTVYPARHGQ